MQTVPRHCRYCSRPTTKTILTRGKHTALSRTKDHIIPRSRGGKKKVTACFQCNQIKGDMAPEIWELFILTNPLWWHLPKAEIRKVRKLAIRMTAEFMRVAQTVPAPSSEDIDAMREHWQLIARCMKAPAAVAQS